MRYDNPEQGKYQLIVRSFDRAVETVLASGPTGQGLNGPAWSPDGKTILCTLTQPGDALSGLVAVDAGTGQQRLILSSPHALAFPTWLPDGKGLLALDSDRYTNYTRSQIVFISYPDGKVTPITRDSNNYSDLSLAASGQVLATVLGEGRWNLSVMSATGGGADARQVGTVASFTSFTWTNDSRLINDNDNILRWVNPDTGAKGVFATEMDSVSVDPWECSDGRHIVFMLGLRSGKGPNIWRADVSGGNLKQLSNGRQDNFPVCSPDSRTVYYMDNSAGRMMKVAIATGAWRRRSLTCSSRDCSIFLPTARPRRLA